MADRKNAENKWIEAPTRSPLRCLLLGEGIEMPMDFVTEDLALFTAEERRELSRGNAEQCEANR